MKTLPTGLAAHYASGTTSLAYALRLLRNDGKSYGFTSASQDMEYDGLQYTATQGLLVSDLETQAGFGVDNLELNTLDDGSLFHKNEVFGGVWRNCKFWIYRYNYLNLADGYETLFVGTLGDITMELGSVKVELRGLQAAFQQSIGAIVSANCRARLGDALCRVDLAPLTASGMVTSVTNRRLFEVLAFTQAEHYFTEGMVTFTSGACKGVSAKVKYSNGSHLELQLPLPTDISPADTLIAVPGCRKRHLEDCKQRFNNSINFQGEPHLPGIDAIVS
jgi:uncharacterized phage protein (TIGR02218 family)